MASKLFLTVINEIHYIHIPLFVLIWLGLYLDSYAMSQQFAYNQWFTNMVVIAIFWWVYTHVSHLIKQLMLYGLFIALCGEVVFSLLLRM